MRHEKKFATVTVLIVIFAASAHVFGKQPNYPSFVRLYLAGGNLADDADYVKYDSKERYYLVATGDCDGASVDLVLTPNPVGYGYDPATSDKALVERVALPRLRTGKGVNIGDTPQQVQRKLGATPHWSSYDRETKKREWVYRASIFMKSREKRGKQIYRGTYTFLNNRLWSIHYNVQEKDGCD